MNKRSDNLWYWQMVLLAIFVVGMSIFVLVTGDNDMFKVLVVVLGILTLYAIGVAVWHEHTRRLREGAIEYLYEVTKEVYFYEYPLSNCIEYGLVQKLHTGRVGDFARPFGELVVYALQQAGDEMARVHWRTADDSLLGPVHKVYVTFAYGGWYWLYDVQGSYLERNEVYFRRAKELNEPGYEMHDYWELPYNTRQRLEECKDPASSQLAPDWYYDIEPKDYPDAVTAMVDAAMRYV